MSFRGSPPSTPTIKILEKTDQTVPSIGNSIASWDTIRKMIMITAYGRGRRAFRLATSRTWGWGGEPPLTQILTVYRPATTPAVRLRYRGFPVVRITLPFRSSKRPCYFNSRFHSGGHKFDHRVKPYLKYRPLREVILDLFTLYNSRGKSGPLAPRPCIKCSWTSYTSAVP